jgi:hypothetical protein
MRNIFIMPLRAAGKLGSIGSFIGCLALNFDEALSNKADRWKWRVWDFEKKSSVPIQ